MFISTVLISTGRIYPGQLTNPGLARVLRCQALELQVVKLTMECHDTLSSALHDFSSHHQSTIVLAPPNTRFCHWRSAHGTFFLRFPSRAHVLILARLS
ncbi:hypothetical protein AZE42_10846 [Rhizopogon vesiculosus]|uniref:Uncharacterized protein n=1 Tax=Rhizopogon vesiculosus TaxID=180088 RepID=A0A1J8QDB7_9AGAM|nr:hypothetical protein AZE42_10846 [Rhizopogon vesiculosus]